MKFLLILVLTGFFALFEQEDQPAKKVGDEQLYKWYVSLSGGGGSSSSPSTNSATTATGQFGFEYRPIPYIGFGLSMGANNWAYKTQNSSSDLVSNLILLQLLGGGSSFSSSSSSSSSSSLFTTLFLLGLLPTSTSPGNLTYNNLGLNFNFHFNGERTFDPYFGIGLIGGSCSGGFVCTVTGGEVRLGIQINFDTFFFFIQGQGQALSFKDQSYNISTNNAMGSLGLGARF